ncbi:hypothetical protein DPMN_044807 [Dreissena polymorpha]|uniref:STAS domain-containing protein n=1 Tax=Dreissena polymorpha TaxID=45954 RepID=A0A9D4D4T5_DREPO|nr:hypothetical protein DPMN_044807 [Dreissena polymorpha]
MRYTEASLEEIVREMLRLEFLSDDITEHLDRIKKCLEKSDHIYVCDLDNKEEIDATILQALLKGILLMTDLTIPNDIHFYNYNHAFC